MYDNFNQWISSCLQKINTEQKIGIIHNNDQLTLNNSSNNIHLLNFKDGLSCLKHNVYDVLLIKPQIFNSQCKIDVIHEIYNHLLSGGKIMTLSIIDSQQKDTSYFWDSQFEKDPLTLKFLDNNKDLIFKNLEHPNLNLKNLQKYFQISNQLFFSDNKPHQLIVSIEGIKKDNVVVQSLWIGPCLTNLERMAIKSFISQGHDFHLYIYNQVEGIPEGTTIKDGNDILPQEEIFTYSNSSAGKSSVSAFSNIFRFKLLFLKGNYWVDTDMVCTQFLNMSEPYLFTSEPSGKNGYTKEKINAGIIKLPIYSIEASFGVNKCQLSKEKILSGEIKWGLGPKTTEALVKKYQLKKFVKPWYFSNSCSCHHWKSLIEDLNWKFYQRIHPNLKEKINTKKKAQDHWNNYGRAEGLMGLPYQHLIIRNLKDKPEGNYCIHLWNQFWNKEGVNKNDSFQKECLFEQLKRAYLET